MVYGPNEAGKTTLLQFVRSMLYGFSAERQRYLPPVHGGRPGGNMDIESPHGASNSSGTPTRRPAVVRHRRRRHAAGRTRPEGAAFGHRRGHFQQCVRRRLREIQELGTLGDTQAAELLYSLASGLDRVSLVEVMHALAESRNRILDAHGGPASLPSYWPSGKSCGRKSRNYPRSLRRYGRLAAERGQLDREVPGWKRRRTRPSTRPWPSSCPSACASPGSGGSFGQANWPRWARRRCPKGPCRGWMPSWPGCKNTSVAGSGWPPQRRGLCAPRRADWRSTRRWPGTCRTDRGPARAGVVDADPLQPGGRPGKRNQRDGGGLAARNSGWASAPQTERRCRGPTFLAARSQRLRSPGRELIDRPPSLETGPREAAAAGQTAETLATQLQTALSNRDGPRPARGHRARRQSGGPVAPPPAIGRAARTTQPRSYRTHRPDRRTWPIGNCCPAGYSSGWAGLRAGGRADPRRAAACKNRSRPVHSSRSSGWWAAGWPSSPSSSWNVRTTINTRRVSGN